MRDKTTRKAWSFHNKFITLRFEKTNIEKTTMRFKFMMVCLLAMAWFRGSCETLTLEQALQRAQANYPLVKRYSLIEQTTEYTVSNLAKGWLPQLGVGAQVTWQNRTSNIGDDLYTIIDPHDIKVSGYIGLANGGSLPIPEDADYSTVNVEMPEPNVKGIGKLQYRAGAEVNQMIWEGGMIKGQQEVARLQSQVQAAQTDVDLYALNDRVADLFFGILLIDEQVQLADDMINLLADSERKLTTLQQKGLATGGDVAAVQAERMRTTQQRTHLTNSRRNFERVLDIFVGNDERTPLTLTRPAELLPNTQTFRPELRLLDNQLALTYAQERLLRSSLMPRVSAFAQGYYGYIGFDMMHDIMHRNPSFNAVVGLRVNWTIGSLYTYRNDRARLNLQRSEIETQRETFLFNTRLKSAQETEAVTGYRRLLADDDQIIDLRVTVRKAAESKLNHGIIDVNNLLQEISKETQARIARSQHQLEMLQHMYKDKIIHNN
ncbi:MAG: TolC family protein [Muribaculaceae bacterium]|nr:TolC family protein [Muribaculaceae bacterium]